MVPERTMREGMMAESVMTESTVPESTVSVHVTTEPMMRKGLAMAAPEPSVAPESVMTAMTCKSMTAIPAMMGPLRGTVSVTAMVRPAVFPMAPMPMVPVPVMRESVATVPVAPVSAGPVMSPAAMAAAFAPGMSV